MRELRLSILRWTSTFMVVQALIGLGLGVSTSLSARLWFLLGLVLYHVAISAGLILLRSYWVTSSDGRVLRRVNSANVVTLYRLTGIPSGVFLLVVLPLGGWFDWAVFGFVASVFLSDFVDGKISRLANQVTEIGKILDSTSDYLVLAAISIVFAVRSMIPAWFLAVFLSRMALQAYYATHLSLLRKGIKAESTWIGKSAVASVMVLFGLVTASAVPGLEFLEAASIGWAVLACAILQGVTAIDKTRWFLQTRREILSTR